MDPGLGGPRCVWSSGDGGAGGSANIVTPASSTRKRVAHLLDPGSFLEMGTLAGGDDAPADAVVMGSGRIEGRPTMVAAGDFTVKAGTISAAANAKRYRVAEIAAADRVPLIMVLEGAGFRADSEHPITNRPARPVALFGAGATDAAVLGASAGHGQLVAPMSGLHRDEPARLDLHGGSTGRLRVARRDDRQGGTRRTVGGGGRRPGAQRRTRRCRRARHGAPTCATSVLGVVVCARCEGGDDGQRPVPELLDIVPRNGRRVYGTCTT